MIYSGWIRAIFEEFVGYFQGSKKPLINKTEFIFNSKKSKEKKKAREERKKRNAKREAHFRRMMRNGSWNKRFDYDDNNYDDDQNAHNDGQYNEYTTNYNEHAIRRSDNEEIKRKDSIESEGKHSIFLLLKGLGFQILLIKHTSS